MNWLSPENVVAIVGAVLGLVAPAAGALYQRRSPRGKRVGHRVQMDTAIGGDGGDGQGALGSRLGLLTTVLPGISNPSLVLLRIENDGTGGIAETDYTNPDKNHGLNVVFQGREVQGVEVIPDPNAEHLLGHFDPVDGNGGMRHEGHTIRLPRVPLNEDEYFKLLVLLGGGRVGDPVTVTGGIREGKVQRTRSMSVDDKPPLFSKPALGTTVVLALCLLTLAGIIVFRHPIPMGCVGGELRIVGSTAFAPAVTKVAHQYMADCPAAEITVDAHGSTEGVRELAEASDSRALVAFSDGPKPAGFSRLREQRVAVVAFAVVVNNQVPVENLTVERLSDIYRGDVVNWNEVGGPDLPIRLISRDANSGTRDLFRRIILGGRGEPAFTSRDCVHKDSEQDKIVRCELGSTSEVLKTVVALPGAIGYSELSAAANTKGLHTVRIGGQAPSVDAIGDNRYRFTAIEYVYTKGPQAADSLTTSFLNFVITGSGQALLDDFGHLPCHSPEGLQRCSP